MSKLFIQIEGQNVKSKYQGGIKHRKGKHFNQIIHTSMNAEGQELPFKTYAQKRKNIFFFKSR